MLCHYLLIIHLWANLKELSFAQFSHLGVGQRKINGTSSQGSKNNTEKSMQKLVKLYEIIDITKH